MRVLPEFVAGRVDLEVGGRAIPAAFGFAAQASQVLLIREILTVFHGNELSTALVLGLWLFWVSVGCAAGNAALRKVSPLSAARVSSFLQLVILPAALFAARNVRGAFDVPPGQYLPLSALVLSSGLLLMPTCLIFGASFAWAVRLSGSAGRTYAMESLGAALGAGLTAVAVPWMGPFAWGAVASAVPFIALLSRTRRAALAGIIAAGLLVMAADPLDRAAHVLYWRHLGPGAVLRETFDAPEGPVAVIERAGEVSVYRSGRLWVTLPERGESAPVAAAVLLQHPHPRRILLFGATATFLPEALRHGPDRVDVVETSAPLFGLIRAADPGSLDDPHVHLHEADLRRFLRGEERWDAILVAAGDPETVLDNRFYTREFFAEAKASLASGGILAVGALTAPSTYASDELLRRNATIFRTLGDVFPRVAAVPGSAAWLLASDTLPLTMDPDELGNRARARGRGQIDLSGVTDPFAVRKASEEFRSGRSYDPLGESLPVPLVVEANLDARPVAMFQSLQAWAWLSSGHEGRILAAAGRVPFWFAVVIFTVPAMFRRRGGAVFCAGFAGMVLAAGLLISFQTAVGRLHEAFGLLIGTFMLGCAVGACIPVSSRLSLAFLALVCGAWAFATDPAVLVVLMLAGGAATGAVYHALTPDPAAGARLYALDVAGGCAAALLAVPFILPLHGVSALAALAAIPCLVSAVLAAR